jgi:hypothetical protein
MSKRAEITVLGQRVAIRGEEANLSAEEIAQFVEARINEVQMRETSQAPFQVLLKAYLELAAAYLTAKQKVHENRERMRDSLTRLGLNSEPGAPELVGEALRPDGNSRMLGGLEP